MERVNKLQKSIMNILPIDIIGVIIYWSILCISDKWHPSVLKRVCKAWKDIYNRSERDRFSATLQSSTKWSRKLLSWLVTFICVKDERFDCIYIPFPNSKLLLVKNVRHRCRLTMDCFIIKRVSNSLGQNTYALYVNGYGVLGRRDVATLVVLEWLKSISIDGDYMGWSDDVNGYIIIVDLMSLIKLIQWMLITHIQYDYTISVEWDNHERPRKHLRVDDSVIVGPLAKLVNYDGNIKREINVKELSNCMAGCAPKLIEFLKNWNVLVKRLF